MKSLVRVKALRCDIFQVKKCSHVDIGNDDWLFVNLSVFCFLQPLQDHLTAEQPHKPHQRKTVRGMEVLDGR